MGECLQAFIVFVLSDLNLSSIAVSELGRRGWRMIGMRIVYPVNCAEPVS